MENRKGLAGLDALILLVAVILVVAVVGSALISTSATLMAKDHTAQKEKQRNIQRPVSIMQVKAIDTDSDKRLNKFVITLRLTETSEAVIFNDTVIIANSKGSNCTTWGYGHSAPPGCDYSLTYLKEGPNYQADRMQIGDIVDITLSGSMITPGIGSSSNSITIVPSHGISTQVDFELPERISPMNLQVWPYVG